MSCHRRVARTSKRPRPPSGFLRSSACAARKTRGSRQKFSGAGSPPSNPRNGLHAPLCSRRVVGRTRSRAIRVMPKTRHFPSAPAVAGVRAAFATRAMDAWSRFVRGLAASGRTAEIRRGLLTVEKTVIRFRPKQTVPARTSEPDQREKRQDDTDLRPDDRQGGRLRFLRENASTPEYPNPQRQPPRVF